MRCVGRNYATADAAGIDSAGFTQDAWVLEGRSKPSANLASSVIITRKVGHNIPANPQFLTSVGTNMGTQTMLSREFMHAASADGPSLART